MSDFTNGAEEYLIEWLLSGSTVILADMPSTAGTWWVRLHTTNPTETGALGLIDTGVWTNYVPIAINRSSAAWSTAASEGATSSGGFRKANSSAIDFGTATLTSDIIVTHVSLAASSASSTAGYFQGELTTTYTIQNGNPVTINTTALGFALR